MLQDKQLVQQGIDRVTHCLARIGAGERVEEKRTKYDLEQLRRIVRLYLDMRFPKEAIKVLSLMEKAGGKELPDDRAVIYAGMADLLVEATAGAHRQTACWVLMWEEVWTYDKVVAVHKEAIAWAKKAKWPYDRITKLEDQITKLPDLLKYVKEPKNWKDLLEGKAKEPVW